MRVLSPLEMFDLLNLHRAIFEYDLDLRRLNWASPAMEALFGYQIQGELEEKPFEELLIPEQRPLFNKNMDAYCENPKPGMVGLFSQPIGLKKTGVQFPIEMMIIPRQVGKRRVVVWIILDLSIRAVV